MLRCCHLTVQPLLDGCGKRFVFHASSWFVVQRNAASYFYSTGRHVVTRSLKLYSTTTKDRILGTQSNITTASRDKDTTVCPVRNGANSQQSQESSLTGLLPRPTSELTLDELASYYEDFRQSALLRLFTPEQHSELINLIGSRILLANPDFVVDVSTPGMHVFKGRLPGEDEAYVYYAHYLRDARYWDLIVTVANDKAHVGHELRVADRYWIMLACLLRARAAKHVNDEGKTSDASRIDALAEADVQFSHIWRRSPYIDVVVFYFKTLFASTSLDDNDVDRIVCRLCDILGHYARPDSRLINMFWLTLLRHGHQLTSEVKETVVSMVFRRLSQQLHSSDQGASARRFLESTNVNPGWHPVVQLAEGFRNAILPSQDWKPQRAWLRNWAMAEARLLFSPSISLETRWHAVNLLAIYALHRPSMIPAIWQNISQSELVAANWGAVLVSAMLEKTWQNFPTTSFGMDIRFQGIIYPLWRAWSQAMEKDLRNCDRRVASTMMSSFIRMASGSYDADLLEQCLQFCKRHDLFSGADPTMENWARLLIADYIQAAVRCDGPHWAAIFTSLELNSRLPSIATLLLQSYIKDQNFLTAFGLYKFCAKHDVELPVAAVYNLAMSLVSPENWEMSMSLLHHLQFSRAQLEQLFIKIIGVLQKEQRQVISADALAAIERTITVLYSVKPPQLLHSPLLRHLSLVMVLSGSPSQALHVIETIHRREPKFFTTRFLLRVMRLLVDNLQPRLAIRLFRLIPRKPAGGWYDFRRKLVLRLYRTDLIAYARLLDGDGVDDRGRSRLSIRESLVRTISSHSRRISVRKIPPILYTLGSSKSAPDIKLAATLLVRGRRFYYARKVFERAADALEPAVQTAICNTILHGPMLHRGLRSMRLVRRILYTKNLLEEKYGFSPDRTTVNIVLKAMLRWKDMVDSEKVKILFDHMVHSGYPVSQRWRQRNGAPFGTPPSSSGHHLGWTSLLPSISFERHARPLYKMFIKAFYSRGDIRAAKTVVGILKEQDVFALRQKEDRNKARRLGIYKKQSNTWKRPPS